ncbi:cilia- and flagella-associated protein 144 isoform X4 [Alligator mississippiensis]|uniref:Protein FAM183A n=1 Tax=Alligator mississippiensis TaxID=8496 RepID=A0A151MKI7_ALLMI|nr:cilia- and flagella-associated protein 144 isoform X4 [Alligator mississippiensis]KYO25061.1 protein FAM183A [Alligator mississippiensis]
MARLHERFGLAPRWERAGSGAGGAQCSAAGPAPAAPAVPGKPLSRHDAAEQPADAKFLNLIHHAALEPIKKYSEPQTESQEIGWTTTPLISVDRTDRRLYFPRQKSEITKYMEATWRLKEQSENMQ